jgi:hypothetical protein
VYRSVIALLRLDMFEWTSHDEKSIYLTPTEVGLAHVGEGSNFRFFAEAAGCDYFDFDGWLVMLFLFRICISGTNST